MYFFLKTISDIGPKRIILRLRYEIRKILDKIIGPSLALRICKIKNKRPIWINSIRNFKSFNANPFLNKAYSNQIKFFFLNESRILSIPIEWNNKNWPRLWQFNLHYFDWIRIVIEYFLDTNKILNSYGQVEYIINDWINSNLPGIGDGWHSYTISQRIRNWIWLLRVFPVLVDEKKINSIWDQLLWLESHPEECHGGNHWLENLISLSLASLQFQGKDSERILKSSLNKLNIELKSQILEDGGHEERSASYHVVILDKLVELACFLQILKSHRPYWLLQIIKKMSKWLENVLLYKNTLPRFNDSVLEACPPPADIIKFAKSYLDEVNYSNKGTRLILINLIKKNEDNNSKLKLQKEELIDLPFTGWTIVHLGKFWELTFKNGISCPKHLPAHAHSDLLSFDLFYKGLPIIAEAGTSIYENCEIRNFERSGKSHNTLQLAQHKANTFSQKKIKWIESIEVWDSFRAARKAKIINRSAKKIRKDLFQISGSHDGFEKYGAFHERYISIKNKKGDIYIQFIEKISCSNPMYIRLCWHLGPNLKKSYLKGLKNQLKEKYNFTNNWDETYFAIGFGKRKIRKSLYSIGFLSSGLHVLKYGLIIKSEDL